MPKFNFRNQSLEKNSFWLELIGSPLIFSLESRIFHSISIGLILLNCLYIPYNLFADLYVASVSGLIFGIFFFLQFYYSRYHGKPHSNILFAFIGLLIFGVNYFTNAGINGSTDIIWPAYLLLVFAISPYRQHLLWLIIYMLCFFLLHIIEYYYPSLIQHPFLVGKEQSIDRITTFPIPVIVIFMVIKFIRKSYDREKEVTEEKSIALAKSNEQILSQKNLLEQSNIEKNKLMSIISHDLRAPLVNIKGYLELLSKNEIAPEERPMLENALLKSTSSTLDMLSNLLHWSKSQMEGTNLQLQEIDLFSILNNTLEIEKLYALKKEITLNYKIPAPLIVIADIDMLQLVVRNLINNAIKFTAKGGLINLNVEKVINQCKITITDSGGGISADKLDHIFSIKSKPSYGTNNEKGVGLGLILCKEFIERQGGSIGFESKPGVGSSFFIFIPLKQQAI